MDDENAYFQYVVEIGGIDVTYKIHEKCFDKSKKFIEENKDIIYSHLLNGKVITAKYGHDNILHTHDWECFVKENEVHAHISSKDQLDNVFLGLCALPRYAGDKVGFGNIFVPDFYLKYYLKNKNELTFYIEQLKFLGLLKIITGANNKPIAYSITYDGITKSTSLTEEGNKSNRCFVAMSFDKEEDYIFDEAIDPVCSELGLKAIRVDRIHPGAEQTINDFIIAEIKRSKFLIADFTKHKDGVYFEAGYGLGRGKKVIYTCNKDYFKDIHFDVNHFPVLIYETAEELKQMLENKIRAFIFD